MAKPIIVQLGGAESSFDFAKIERAKLYGSRKRVPLDMDGQPCIRSSLTTDGLYLLLSGMTAQGYFDEAGRWLHKSQLVGILNDEVLAHQPSTLGAVQTLEAVPAENILQHTINAVYALDPLKLDSDLQARLDAGEVYRFPFNYVAGYQQDAAFLLKNSEGYFCLIGEPITVVWSEPGKVNAAIAEDSASADDLDFDMF